MLENGVGYQHIKIPLEKSKEDFRKKFKLLAKVYFMQSTRKAALIVSTDLCRLVCPYLR